MSDVRFDTLVSAIFGLSREQAKQSILEGKCRVDGQIKTKPGAKFSPKSDMKFCGEIIPYVSRGGIKLAHALTIFGIDPSGLNCLDIGASTGGFTDCLLQSGAKSVIALDNGSGQLHPKLTTDSRVISLENSNIRHIKPSDLPFLPEFITCDVSFISLALVIPTVSKLLAPSQSAVLLLKPQFECGPKAVNKQGVIKDHKEIDAAIRRTSECLAANQMPVRGLAQSPICGQNGNVEYLIYAEKVGDTF